MSIRTLCTCDRCDTDIGDISSKMVGAPLPPAITMTRYQSDTAVGCDNISPTETRSYEHLCSKCQQTVANYVARIFKLQIKDADDGTGDLEGVDTTTGDTAAKDIAKPAAKAKNTNEIAKGDMVDVQCTRCGHEESAEVTGTTIKCSKCDGPSVAT